ncbi:UNVERIFIED_CONTAM: hypothetical protein HDU68_009909 [Siphonaria sp. JEL0065]|nr:hypothetical protein HDU68_009909 [Siphonaria sp. JEL0065]
MHPVLVAVAVLLGARFTNAQMLPICDILQAANALNASPMANQLTELPAGTWIVTADSPTYTPGQAVKLTMNGPSYQGFMMYANPANQMSARVGSLSLPSGMISNSAVCSKAGMVLDNANSCITSSNTGITYPGAQTIVWTAPMKSVGDVHLNVMVMQKLATGWGHQIVPCVVILKCTGTVAPIAVPPPVVCPAPVTITQTVVQTKLVRITQIPVTLTVTKVQTQTVTVTKTQTVTQTTQVVQIQKQVQIRKCQRLQPKPTMPVVVVKPVLATPKPSPRPTLKPTPAVVVPTVVVKPAVQPTQCCLGEPVPVVVKPVVQPTQCCLDDVVVVPVYHPPPPAVERVQAANYAPQAPANVVAPNLAATTATILGYVPPMPNSSTVSPNFLTPSSVLIPKVVTCQPTPTQSSLKILPAALTPSTIPSSVSVPKVVICEPIPSITTQIEPTAITPSTTISTAAYIPPNPITSAVFPNSLVPSTVLVPKVVTCQPTAPSKIAPAPVTPSTAPSSVSVRKVATCESTPTLTPSKTALAAVTPSIVPSSISVPKVVACEPTPAPTSFQPTHAAVIPSPTCPPQSISTVFSTILITKTVESMLTITQFSTLIKTVLATINTTVTETVTQPKKCKHKTSTPSSISITPIYAPPTPPANVQVKPVQQTNYIAPTPLSYATAATTLNHVLSAPAAQTATKTPLYVPAMAGKKREIPKATDVNRPTLIDFVATRTDGETSTVRIQKMKQAHTATTRIIPTFA